MSIYCWIYWTPIIYGQIISIFNTGTGAFEALLANGEPAFNYPAIMVLLNYTLLITFLFKDGCYLIFDKSKNQLRPPNRRQLRYMLAALLDFLGGFTCILAYKYTTLTSVTILASFVVPFVMLLSYYFLNYRYTYKHIIGMVVSMSGLVIIMTVDMQRNNGSSNSANNNTSATAINPILGDMLIIISSFMYACSNILQESIVKSGIATDEFFGFLGVYGTIISSIQVYLYEYNNIQSLKLTYTIIIYILLFEVCLYCFVVNTSYYLKYYDSTIFNLSLLSTDIYSVIISYFIYGYFVHYYYFIAYTLVCIGLIIYNREGSPGAFTSVTGTNLTTDLNLTYLSLLPSLPPVGAVGASDNNDDTEYTNTDKYKSNSIYTNTTGKESNSIYTNSMSKIDEVDDEDGHIELIHVALMREPDTKRR